MNLQSLDETISVVFVVLWLSMAVLVIWLNVDPPEDLGAGCGARSPQECPPDGPRGP